jgi:hypothetical protein
MAVKKEQIMELSMKLSNGSSMFTTIVISTSHQADKMLLLEDFVLMRVMNDLKQGGWAVIERSYRKKPSVVVEAASGAVALISRTTERIRK